MPSLDLLLLIGAVVALVAIFAARLGSRFGLPSLLLFLALGMAIGDAGLGVRFSDADLAHQLGFAALVLILAEGGLTTKWENIRGSLRPAAALATIGIGVSIGLMALFSHYVLALPWSVAFLLGAITAPTDSAAVFSVLRGLPLPSSVRATLEAESGLNDAPTVLMVAAMTALAIGHEPHGGLAGLMGLIIVELTGGVLLGLAAGFLGVFVLRRIALPNSGLYPLAALAWAVASYGTGVAVHVSGFAAVYVCALILGNGQLPHRHAVRSFAEGIGWIAQIGLFVMLGLLASPGRITWATIATGLAAGLFLTLIARPLSVLASVSWFRVPPAEQIFLSWAGLRGAVPIILATVPMAARAPDADKLFDVVLVFVVVFTAIQAPTLPWVARKLGLADPDAAHDVDIEAAPLDKISADLLQIRVPEGSRLAGVAVSELRLPPNAIVSLIIRAGVSFAPNGRDVLRAQDELLIVTPQEGRKTVETRLTEIGRGGRLARWKGVKAE
ncbi:MAG TPA: potassium/proton antiporter [Propionibacteriaceae bacterium]|nr:potassium/proton antiporter [Propionibacteriaceae bacterium]